MTSVLCRFCAGALGASRAKEHVIPQWLIDYLGVRDRELTPTHFSANREILSGRKHKVPSLLEGKVCATCNNGWMSGLEATAKPILIPLIEGNRGAVELTGDERLTVARWAAKTAYVLNSSSNFRPIVPAEHFHDLHASADALPPGVHVFAQQHHDEASELYWLQGQVWVPVTWHDDAISKEQVLTIAAGSYKFLLHFKKLMLIIAYWPEPDWNLIAWQGIHIPMYPTKGPISYYGSDPVEFDWYDWRQAQGALFSTLGVNRRDDGEEAFSAQPDSGTEEEGLS